MLLLNVHSIRNKIDGDVQTLLLMDDFDIIALTETWLEENFGDRELLHLDGCNTFRRDRPGRGGGVLLATKLHLPCIRRHDLEVDAEMVVYQLTTCASQHLLFSVYDTHHRTLEKPSWKVLRVFLTSNQILA